MKLNKHSLDILMRLNLYILPLFLLFLSAKSFRDGDTISQTTTTYNCSFNFYQRYLGSFNGGVEAYFDPIEISFDTYNYLLNNSSYDDETGIYSTNFVVYFKALYDLPISNLILGPSNSHLQFFLNYFPQYNFYSIDIIPNFYLSYMINNYTYGTEFYYGDYNSSTGEFEDGYFGSDNYIVPLNNYFTNLDYSLTFYDVFTGGFTWNLTDIDGNSIQLVPYEELFDYDLPLFSVSSVAVSSTSTLDYPNFNVEFNNVMKPILDLPLVSDFYQWFKLNIIEDNVVVIENVFAWVFYLVFVEFAILLKNILIFIFYWANKMIERGLKYD